MQEFYEFICNIAERLRRNQRMGHRFKYLEYLKKYLSVNKGFCPPNSEPKFVFGSICLKMQKNFFRTRIAPTPSGFLHLGHAKTFLETQKIAKENKGQIVLRIEDIDLARCKKEYISQIYLDLKKIGIVWDEGPDIGGKFAPYMQSERKNYYWQIVETLIKKGFAYPCSASRAQIKTEVKIPARTFNFCDAENIFPINLRPKKFEMPDSPKECNWRFKVPENRLIEFADLKLGTQKFEAQKDFGDFLIWRKSGEPSYELAVVADDIAMQITDVIRGEDLLLSTARQILIYEALNAEIPSFTHLGLLLNESGKKLSKSVLVNETGNSFLIKNLPSDFFKDAQYRWLND